MKGIATITISALLLLQGVAFAQVGEKHTEKHKAKGQTQKLHHMMPKYATALAKLEAALEKGDLAAIEAEAGKMLTTSPDLKNSKPHKNLKQLKEYRRMAADLERDLKETVELAKKGDIPKVRDAFKKVEAKCAECHAKFR